MTNRKRAFSLIELLFVIAIISLLAALLFPVFEKAREQGRGAVCLSNQRNIGMSLHLYLQDYDETFPMNRFPDDKHAIEGCKLESGSTYPIGSLENSSLNWRRAVQTYLKNKQVMVCPSNPYPFASRGPGDTGGDQTNHYYLPKDYLPLSYAYNGNFFHEAVPPCLYKEKLERPRTLPEIGSSSSLIMLVESRLPYPDLGNWFFTLAADPSGKGAYQSHNGGVNFLFADLHAKKLKLAATCKGKMWADTFPEGSDVCQHLDQLADEYR